MYRFDFNKNMKLYLNEIKNIYKPILMELLIFVSFILFALWSILGFGKLFETLFFDGSVNINIGLTGFFGLFILSSVAYITHLFAPHNYIHNLILLFLG